MMPSIVVGTSPWLPEPLAQSRWWTQPVRAERLAALRIGVGAMLLLDIFCFYLPRAGDFFGAGSLGSPEVFAGRLGGSSLRWSLLGGISDGSLLYAILIAWAIAAFCLMIGFLPRASAIIAWLIAMSVHNANFYLHNSGDNVKLIALFYLMLCPAGAVWAVRTGRHPARPTYVHPWPLRLIMLQLAVIYFVNGVYKLSGGDWRSGEVMHYVLNNVAWTRFAAAQLPLPDFSVPVMTYTTLIWELGFPALMLFPRLRATTLWLGVAFHLGTALLLQLGMFPAYMLCLYLPLVPWERFTGPTCGLPNVEVPDWRPALRS